MAISRQRSDCLSRKCGNTRLCIDGYRNIVIRIGVVTYRPCATSDRYPICPSENQVIATASIVVRYKIINRPAKTQRDRLALSQIGERAVDEVQPGVLDHH